MGDSNESVLISKLSSKISNQALELGELTSVLESKNEYIEKLEMELSTISSPATAFGSSRIGESASKKRVERETREKFDLMKKQLDSAEARCLEFSKANKQLTIELESKSRESKLREKKLSELRYENESLQLQLQRVSTGVQSKQEKPVSSEMNSFRKEIRRLQKDLDTKQREIEEKNEVQATLEARNRVLEDALSFRSEDLGLAGHADLLANLSKLRGEISFLKNQLTRQTDDIDEVSKLHNDAENRSQFLQAQIQIIQQKLLHSQEQLGKFSSSDIATQLVEAEKERDLLLEFVQGDMEKSSRLAELLSKSEAQSEALRQEQQINHQRFDNLEKSLDASRSRVRELESEVLVLRNKTLTMESEEKTLRRELALVTDNHQRKSTEVEDLRKFQIDLLVENKSREDQASSLIKQCTDLQTRLQELEMAFPSLQQDNESLRQRLRTRDEEVDTLKASLSQFEPAVGRLEPEVNRLRLEKQEWLKDRSKLDSELELLRPIGTILTDLSLEMDRLKPQSELTQSSLSSSGLKHSFLSSSQQSHFDTLTHKHAIWTGLSSIRKLSAPLHEAIRCLAQDLHRVETELLDLKGTNETLIREADIAQTEFDEDIRRLSEAYEQNCAELLSARASISALTSENEKQKQFKTIIEQVKVVMKSFPGGLSSLIRPSLSQGDERYSQEFEDSSSAEEKSYSDCQTLRPPSAASLLLHHSRRQRKENECPETRSDLSRPSKQSKVYFEIFGKSKKDEEAEIPDHLLPEIVGKAILFNSASSMSLPSVKAELGLEKQEKTDLQSQVQSLMQEISELHREISRIKQERDDAERAKSKSTSDLQREIASAAELAEKQNALTVSLESKLESVRRERQLKAAQLTSVLQREQQLRDKLLSALDEHARETGTHEFPPSDAKIQDLVRTVLELLSHCTLNHRHHSASRSTSRPRGFSSDSSSSTRPTLSPSTAHHSIFRDEDLGRERIGERGSNKDVRSSTESLRGRSYGVSSDSEVEGVEDDRDRSPSHRTPPSSRSPSHIDWQKEATRRESRGERSKPSNRGGGSSSEVQEKLRKAQIVFSALREHSY